MSSLADIESAVDSLPLPEQKELLHRLATKLESRGGKEFPVCEDHVRLLDERFASYREDPRQASTWEDVKRRFEDRRG